MKAAMGCERLRDSTGARFSVSDICIFIAGSFGSALFVRIIVPYR